MKLQSSLISSNQTKQEDIKSIIESMQPEIANIFCSALQQEVSAMLGNLTGMTEIIEDNFVQIKHILQ